MPAGRSQRLGERAIIFGNRRLAGKLRPLGREEGFCGRGRPQGVLTFRQPCSKVEICLRARFDKPLAKLSARCSISKGLLKFLRSRRGSFACSPVS